MSILRPVLATMLLASLAACDSPVIPGPIAQLQRYEKAEGEGRSADIVGEAISSDCAGGASASDACPKLHAIRAWACLTQAGSGLGDQLTCPGTGARSALTCATEEYGAVLSAPAFSASQRDEFREMHARAAYCLANLSGSSAKQALGQQAAGDLQALSPNARRDHLAANVSLLLASTSSGQARCALYRQAAGQATRGLAAGPSSDQAAGLRSALTNAQSSARSAGCGGV